MANQVTVKDTQIHVGDTIRVFYRIIEKEEKAGKTKREVKQEVRERLQPYEGIVIGIRGDGDNKSFTVRRMGLDGVGIERIFPVLSPWISKVTIKKRGFPKRAKLNYIRDLKGQNRIRSITLAKKGKEKVTSKS